MTDKRFLNARELAERLGFTQRQIQTWVRKGLPGGSGRHGRPARFELETVKAWLAERNLGQGIRIDKESRHLAELASETASNGERPPFASEAEPSPAGSDDAANLVQLRIRRETAEAQLGELRYMQQIGLLVERAEVERELEPLISTMRDSMMAIPDRLAPLVAAESSEHRCHQMISAEVRAALNELATRAGIEAKRE